MLPIPQGLRCELPVRRNPYIQGVQARCLDWSARMGLVPDARALTKIKKIAIDEIAARTYPSAEPELLQLFADMLVWFFVADDQYDERKIGASPQKMEKICANFVRILQTENTRLAISPLGHALLDLRGRLARRTTTEWMTRFTANMNLYFAGCHQESQNRQNQLTPEFDDYREIRRASVGSYPCFDLMELAMQRPCSQDFIGQPVLATLRDLATDMIAWINDIVSYQKESSFNDPHNMISVLMSDCGITESQACAKTVEFINEQLNSFKSLSSPARSSLGPTGGEYIDGLESWIRGVFDWSFVSERYSSDYIELSQQSTHVLVSDEGISQSSPGSP